tara:strand:+ start:280 stop:501 length:222 start_codon:yes stop_codon:yes gene_type:complete
VDGEILVEHIHLVHIMVLAVVEHLQLGVLVEMILLATVVLVQDIRFMMDPPITTGQVVEEVETKLLQLLVLED